MSLYVGHNVISFVFATTLLSIPSDLRSRSKAVIESCEKYCFPLKEGVYHWLVWFVFSCLSVKYARVMLSILPNLIHGLAKLNEIMLLLHIFLNDFPTNTFSLVIHRCTHAASYFRSTCFK